MIQPNFEYLLLTFLFLVQIQQTFWVTRTLRLSPMITWLPQSDRSQSTVMQVAFLLNFFCLSSQESLVYLIFALMVHEYCQCVAFLFHFQISSEILHKLNKITLQIRREIPFIILDIYVATSYQGKNKDSDFKQICFEENELIDLNFTNKCSSPQRL